LVEPLKCTIEPRSPKLHYIPAGTNVGPMLARVVHAASFDATHRQNNDLSSHHRGFFN
jgi:hypothetical protein